MLEEQQEFSALMKRVWNRSDGAARAFVEQFGPYLIPVIRRRLDKQLRSKFDSADFVQAVWASFFAMPHHEGQFECSEALIWFLMKVAQNKVIDAVRQRMLTQKCDVKRERPTAPCNFFGREPSPSEVAIAREEFDKLKQEQPDHYRQILDTRSAGWSVQEIADHLDVAPKTVRRVMDRFRRRVQR